MATRKYISRKTRKNVRTQRGGYFEKGFRNLFKTKTKAVIPPERTPDVPMRMKNTGHGSARIAIMTPELHLVKNPLYSSSTNLEGQGLQRKMSFTEQEAAYGKQWNNGSRTYIGQIHNTNHSKINKILNILKYIQSKKNTDFKGNTTKYNYSKIKKLAVNKGLSIQNAINLAKQIQRVGTSRLLSDAHARQKAVLPPLTNPPMYASALTNPQSAYASSPLTNPPSVYSPALTNPPTYEYESVLTNPPSVYSPALTNPQSAYESSTGSKTNIRTGKPITFSAYSNKSNLKRRFEQNDFFNNTRINTANKLKNPNTRETHLDTYLSNLEKFGNSSFKGRNLSANTEDAIMEKYLFNKNPEYISDYKKLTPSQQDIIRRRFLSYNPDEISKMAKDDDLYSNFYAELISRFPTQKQNTLQPKYSADNVAMLKQGLNAESLMQNEYN